MLASIVGNVDANAAFVLAVAFVTICIMVTATIVKRRSNKVIANEFALAKLKEENEDRRKLYDLETNRQFKFKQIDKNLITSHRASGGDDD